MNRPMHKTLLRQVRKALGLEAEAFASWMAQAPADPDAPGVESLFEAISEAYEHGDREIAIAERSLAVSSEEASEAQERLREELERSARSVEALREAARSIQSEELAVADLGESSDLDSLALLLIDLSNRSRESGAALREAMRDLEAQKFALDQHAIVSISDPQGNIIYANDRFCAISGYERSELIGRNHRIVKSAAHGPEFFEAMWSTIASGRVWEGEICNRAKGGRLYWVAATIVPFLGEDGLPKQYVGIRTDITERKIQESMALAARDEAQAANRAKSEFLANMSHEIRTPMNGVIGMTELALDGDVDAETKEMLKVALSSAEALMSIINDILDFSKIEAGKMQVDSAPFKLRETIGEALKTIAPVAHKKGLELVFDPSADLPDWVVGDAGRLRQVLLNLAGNAVKFTERGVVLVAARRSGPGRIELSVKDTGIGIEPEKQALIFEAFSQADGSTTRKYGGTGLGLTISSRLVALMGGALAVESSPGEGSRFYFEAALPSHAGAPSGPGPLAAEKLAGKRVLAVDDNAVNRRVLSETLGRWGMECRCAASGQEAIESLLAADADLVLMDALMPGIDGFVCAALLRALPGRSEVPMILLSSSMLKDDPARCRDAGFAANLSKPVLRDELLETILKVLGASPERVRPEEPPASPDPVLGALSVLLVEDNPVNRKLAGTLLSKWGHSVDEAESGEAALEKLDKGSYDVVLMDVQMPGIDGLETTRRFRRSESGKRTPIVALTANAMEGDREACLEAGMDDYLSKPLRREALAAALERSRLGPRLPEAAPRRAEAAPEKPVASAAFDYAGAIQAVDAEILELVGEMFRKSWPEDLAAMEALFRAGDAKALGAKAHALKSGCAVFGADPLEEACAKIEAWGRAGTIDGAEEELRRLSEGFPEFDARLVEALGKI